MLKTRQQPSHKSKRANRQTKRHASSKKPSQPPTSDQSSKIHLDQLLARKQLNTNSSKPANKFPPLSSLQNNISLDDDPQAPNTVIPQPIHDPFLAASPRSSFTHAFNPDLSKHQLFLKSAQRSRKLNTLDLSQTPSTPSGQQLIDRNWGVQNIIAFLKTQKVSQMVVFDTSGQNPSCDFTIVCNVSSSKPMQALTEKLVALGRMNKGLHYDRYTAGEDPDGLWSVADLVNVVVHVLTPVGRTAPMFQRVERKLLVDAKLVPFHDWNKLLDPWKRQDQDVLERIQEYHEDSIHNLDSGRGPKNISRTKYKTWEQVVGDNPHLAGQPPPPGFYVRGNKKAITATYNDTDDDEADFNYLDLNEEHMNKMQLMNDMGYQDEDVQIDPEMLGKSVMGTVELLKVNIDHYRDHDDNNVLQKPAKHQHVAADDHEDDDDAHVQREKVPGFENLGDRGEDDSSDLEDAPDHVKAKKARTSSTTTPSGPKTTAPKKTTKKAASKSSAKQHVGAIENNESAFEPVSKKGKSSTSIAGDKELNGSSLGGGHHGRGRKRTQVTPVRDGNIREFSTFLPRSNLLKQPAHSFSTKSPPKQSNLSKQPNQSTHKQSVTLTHTRRSIHSEPDSEFVSLTSTSSKSTLHTKQTQHFHSTRNSPIEGFSTASVFDLGSDSAETSDFSSYAHAFTSRHSRRIANSRLPPMLDTEDSQQVLGLDLMLLGANDTTTVPRPTSQPIGRFNRRMNPNANSLDFDSDLSSQMHNDRDDGGDDDDDDVSVFELASTHLPRPSFSGIAAAPSGTLSGSDWMDDLDDITKEHHEYAKHNLTTYDPAESLEFFTPHTQPRNISAILHKAASGQGNDELHHLLSLDIDITSRPQPTHASFGSLHFEDDEALFNEEEFDGGDDDDDDEDGMGPAMATLGGHRSFTNSPSHFFDQDLGISDALASHGSRFNPHELDADEDCDLGQFTRLLAARPGSLKTLKTHTIPPTDAMDDEDDDYEDDLDDLDSHLHKKH